MNVIAYAKGWLTKSNNIYLDLFVCLMADGYRPKSDNDVFQIVKNNFCKIYNPMYLDVMLTELSENNCYKYGYWTKGNCNLFGQKVKTNKYPKYDYQTALLYYIISYYQMLEISKFTEEEQIELNKIIEQLKLEK